MIDSKYTKTRKDRPGCLKNASVSTSKKWLVWTTLSAQVVTLLSSAWLPVVHAAALNDSSKQTSVVKKTEALNQSDSEGYAAFSDNTQTLAGILSQKDSANAASALARGAAANQFNQRVENWLNLYGTARVALNVDAKGGLDGSAADVLFPLYDRDSWLVFNALGLRHVDQRTTGNLGLGSRYFTDSWMFGLNTFLDNDFTGKNRRFSVGAELGRDFVKVSGNTYWRISNWHQSRDFVDYDERPANGYDLRFEGWLPVYPQLGGTLAYEKYRGDQVALFGKDNRQKDPSALTMGVNYTPVPLVTLGTHYRTGSGGNNETQFNLQLNYRLGEKWSDQLDADRVKQNRTLAGSRYDLVDRNNNIVLDYRRNDTVTLDIAQKYSGNAGENLLIKGTVRSKYPLKAVDWDISSMVAAGGKIVQQQQESVIVMLPAYRYNREINANKYTISAVARDEKGNTSKPAQTMVEVMPAIGSFGEILVVKNGAVANQVDYNQITAVILDNQGQPLENVEVLFSSPMGAVLSGEHGLTNAEGKVTVDIRHNKAVSVPVTLEVSGKQQTSMVNFIADSSTATFVPGSYLVKQDNAVADGGSFNQVTGRVVDAQGNPVSGMKITLSATNDGVVQGDIITNEQGEFVADIVNKKAGETRVVAQVNGQSLELSTHFIPDNGSASPALTLVTDNSPANGSAFNSLQVKVVDANNNVVPGQSVTVSASNGAKVQANPVTTDANGVAMIAVSNTLAGISSIVIETNGKQRKLDTRFIPDSATAKVAALQVEQDGVVANGVAADKLRAVVKDAFNNLVKGQKVSFAATNGAAIAGNDSETDEQGEVVITVTNTRAGISNVSAALNNSRLAQDIKFIADASTAKIDDAAFAIVRDRAEAGKDANLVTMKIVDAFGNPVAGSKVSFTATNGATPAAAEAVSGNDGMINMAINGTNFGATVVTAKSGNTLTRTMNFMAINKIQGLDLANGALRNYQPSQAFPKTATKGAAFNILINDQAVNASDYTWSSSDAGVTVNASGKVTFNDAPANRTVTISAKDKKSATLLTYRFTNQYWALAPSPNPAITYADAKAYCASNNGVLPNATMIGAQGVRGTGSLFGEWGDLSPLANGLFWSDNALYHFHQDSGNYHENAGVLTYLSVCVK